jgi:hypothetical protein
MERLGDTRGMRHPACVARDQYVVCTLDGELSGQTTSPVFNIRLAPASLAAG